MTDDRGVRRRGTESPLSKAMNEKVHPIATAGVVVFIVGFILLVIAVQQFPESWFVQTYLRGYRGVIAALLFWCAVMSAMAFVEGLMKRRKANGKRDR